jgi:hypothetical protein
VLFPTVRLPYARRKHRALNKAAYDLWAITVYGSEDITADTPTAVIRTHWRVGHN